jgi:hypothetical protein
LSLLQLNAKLQNVGFGPAMRVQVVAHHVASRQTQVLRFAVMSVGDEALLERSPKPILFDVTDVAVDPPEVAGQDRRFTVTVSWENVFGGRQLEEYYVDQEMQHRSRVSHLQRVPRRLPSVDEAEVVSIPDYEDGPEN